MNTFDWTIKQIVPAAPGWRARYKSQKPPCIAFEIDVAAWALVSEPMPRKERELAGGHEQNVFVAAMVAGDAGALCFAAEAVSFNGLVGPSDRPPASSRGRRDQETMLSPSDVELLRKLHGATTCGDGGAWDVPFVEGLTAPTGEQGRDPEHPTSLVGRDENGALTLADFERSRDAAFVAKAHQLLPLLLDDLEYLQKRVRELSR